MRILYLTPTDTFSGGERVTLDIAKAMQSRGHTVVYCGVEGSIRSFARAAGVPFLGYPAFTPKAVRKAVRDFRPDLIHTMDFRASLYASLTGVPFIAHLHNDPPWLGGLGPNVWAMRFFGARAAHILTVSESVMAEYRFGAALVKKTTVIGNTVDGAAVRAAAEKTETLPEAFRALTPDLLFFGRLTEQKDPLRFLALVSALKKKLPALTAVMIGEGEMRPAVEEKIAADGLADTVTLTGFLDPPYPLAARAKLLLMPSRWEGFGLTCVESLTLGLPCLVSPVGGLKKLVTDECGGVCETDTDFLVRAERLLTDGDAYAKAAQAARERALLYTDTERAADRIEAVYRDALDQTKNDRK